MPKAKANRKFEPIGTIQPYMGDIAKIPSNYMICDGNILNKEEYPGLFEVIGTAWGEPNVNTFNLPDLRGRFLRGVDKDAAGNPTSPARDPDRDTRTGNAGGNTGNNVGSVQGDTIRNITGTWAEDRHSSGANGGGAMVRDNVGLPGDQGGSGTGGGVIFTFNASRVVPVGSDMRPINISTIYIIRVK